MYISDVTEELVNRARSVAERGAGDLARKWLAAHDCSKPLPPIPIWLQEILSFVVEHDVVSPSARFIDVPPKGRALPGKERHFLVLLDLIERKLKTGRYARPSSAKSIDAAAKDFAEALKRLADR